MSDVNILAEWLSGEYTNSIQALEQPTWFVQVHVWHRLLPTKIDGHIALFAEQANILYKDNPYRQRIALLKSSSIQYLAFKEPQKYKGAGVDPAKLEGITMADVEFLPGCMLQVSYSEGVFKAQPPPETKCYFQYDGKTRQVVLGLEVGKNYFLSYDRGVDPDTGNSLWGAIMGPYHYIKCSQ